MSTGELLEFTGDNGRLEYADGAIVPVSSFRASELEEGAGLQVTVSEPRVIGEGLGAQDSPRSFLGTTSDGLTVRLQGHLYLSNVNVSDPRRMIATYICLGGDALRVTSEQPSDHYKGPLTAQFDIFNCSFAGAITSQYGSAWSRDKLQLEVDSRVLQVVQARNYRELLNQISETGGRATTARLTTSVDEFADLAALEAIVERVCDLWTLATGTLVTWVGYRVIDQEGRFVGERRRATPTRGYSGGALIDKHHPRELAHFIESTYDTFAGLEAPLELRRVVHAYVDGMVGGFLQTKALALGVLGEYLVAASLRWKDINHQFVPSAIARPLGKALLRTGEQFYISHTLTLGSNLHRATEALRSNLSRVTDATLQQKLRLVNDSLGAGLEREAIRSFVTTRNDLAHDMDFDAEQGTPTAQYRNMRYVVDRLILALLGYKGPFIDFRRIKKDEFAPADAHENAGDQP